MDILENLAAVQQKQRQGARKLKKVEEEKDQIYGWEPDFIWVKSERGQIVIGNNNGKSIYGYTIKPMTKQRAKYDMEQLRKHNWMQAVWNGETEDSYAEYKKTHHTGFQYNLFTREDSPEIYDKLRKKYDEETFILIEKGIDKRENVLVL